MMDKVGPIEMKTNHFKIKVKADAPPLYKHLVEITDSADENTRLFIETRREVLTGFLAAEKIDPKTIVYDGDRLMYSTQKINLTKQVCMGRKSITVVVSPQGAALQLQAPDSADETVDRERDQCLDIIMKSASRSKTHQKNERVFLHENKRDAMVDLATLGRGPQSQGVFPKQFWMGHIQSVGVSLDNAMTAAAIHQRTLCLNSAGAVAFDRMPCDEFVRARTQRSVCSMRAGQWDPKFGREVERQIKGLKFEVAHLGLPRKSKFVGIVEKTARTHFFEMEGSQISVMDYFKKKYKITLKYPDAPLIQKVPKKAENYLPIEMVWLSKQTTINAVTDYIKGLIGGIMTMDPGNRLAYITDSVQSVYGSNDVLSQFGVQLDKDAMVIKGTVLAPPSLLYARPGGSTAATIP